MHKYINEIPDRDYDNTYKDRRNCMDIAVISYSLLEYVKSCKLVNFNKIMNSNYRWYLVDLNIVEYFRNSNSIYDDMNEIILNLSKRSHRKKFVKTIKHYIEIFKIEEMLEEVEK